ncbi:MAG: caspase family protein [Bacteroidetes bacterium]|nr:caspase family protein [Bacteroidota bacterium]
MYKKINNNLLLLSFAFICQLCVGQEVRLRLPSGAVYNTNTISFSPDGKNFITSQMDNTYNIWEVGSGKRVSGAMINSATPNGEVLSKFSPRTKDDPRGGKYYFILGNFYYLCIFSTQSFDPNFCASHVHPKDSIVYRINYAEFSPDGKCIVTASDDRTAILWDIESGKILHQFKGHKHKVNHVSFSPDGKKLVTASTDKTAKVWDVLSGDLLTTLSHNKKNRVFTAKFSPACDGDSLGGKYIMTEASDSKLRIWDARSGKLVHELIGHNDLTYMAQFSPNGKEIVSTSFDSTAILWDVESGLKKFQFRAHQDEVIDATFSPNGKVLATASFDHTVILWDIATGKEIMKLGGHKYGLMDIEFSPICDDDKEGGRYIVTADRGPDPRLWDTKTGELLTVFQSRCAPVMDLFIENKGTSKELTFLADGKINSMNFNSGRVENQLSIDSGILSLVSRGDPNVLKPLFFNEFDNGVLNEIDSKSGEIIRTFNGHSKYIYHINLSPDLNYLATTASDTTVLIWDYTSGKLLHRFSVFSFNSVFNRESTQLITYDIDGKIVFWDLKSGKKTRTISSTKPEYSSVGIFNTAGDILVLSCDEIIFFWNLKTGKEIKKLDGQSGGIFHLEFSKDEKSLIATYNGKNVLIWDLSADTVLLELTHTKDVNSIQVFENENLIYTGCGDGGIHIWNTTTGDKILSQYQFDSNPNLWVHLHPSGYFDASPEAMELMYWTKGLEVIEFSQLKDRYWLPGLWEKVLKGESLPAIRDMGELKMQPKVILGDLKDGKVPVTLYRRDGGYGKISIFVNGKEIQADARGDNFDSSKVEQTIYVDIKDHPNLIDGENTIAVRTSSQDGFVTGLPVQKGFSVAFQKTNPHFYAVVIGTGKYSNSAINLKYPEKDAEAMSTALKLGGEGLFGKDNTHVYTLSTNQSERPTKDKIKELFATIAQKATSTDVVLVYLSGHGIVWGGEKGDFYYLTTDATAANSEAYNDEFLRKRDGISTSEWTEMLTRIPALKQVMIIDACSSGKAVENLIASRDIDASQIKAIDRMKDRTGMFVISGSAADAASYEASRYGQGLLTYSILEAMKGFQLRDNEYFDVNIIFNYAREKVPVLAAGLGGIQKPQLLIPKGGSFDIGRVDDEAKAKIPLNSIKPVFVRSILLNTDEMEDVLALSKAVDEKLNALASRGSEGKIVFLDVREYSEGYRLSGGYTLNNGIITLRLKIKGPTEMEQIISGSTKQDVIDQIIGIVEQLK